MLIRSNAEKQTAGTSVAAEHAEHHDYYGDGAKEI